MNPVSRVGCIFGKHRWTQVDLWVGYCWDCGEQYDDTPENAAEIIAEIVSGQRGALSPPLDQAPQIAEVERLSTTLRTEHLQSFQDDSTAGVVDVDRILRSDAEPRSGLRSHRLDARGEFRGSDARNLDRCPVDHKPDHPAEPTRSPGRPPA